jgi:predicted alpha/beta superfamily hydrolase
LADNVDNIGDWTSYTAGLTPEQHTVRGELLIKRGFYSPQLNNRRDLLVWLPPSYHHSDKRYPVLYMHDGQNLFDAKTSYVGEWQVDETMQSLSETDPGCEAIIVGLPNQEGLRPIEYNPYTSILTQAWDGRGEDYIRFIVETVKPEIDSTFRTRPEAATTGLAGSSMGGLISLYGFLTRPEIFGACGAFSTAYWFSGSKLFDTISSHAQGTGRVYLDVGTEEGYIFNRAPSHWGYSPEDGNRAYVDAVRRVRDELLARGYRLGDTLMYAEELGAQHNEAAWARRFPGALRFLLVC